MRVAITESDDEPDVHARVRGVVDEPAAIGCRVERPAERVHDLARAMLRGVDLPDLLEADPVVLRIGVRTQVEACFQPPAEVATAALGEHRVLRAQLVAGLVARLVRAVTRHAHVARHDAGDTIAVVEHVGGGEARQHVAAERFRLAREPLAQLAETDDEVAAIVECARHERLRQPQAAACGAQPFDPLCRHRRLQRRSPLTPIREQLVERTRLEHGARHDVRANGCALLDDTDRELSIRGTRELREPARRREARRPRANHHDIELHALA